MLSESKIRFAAVGDLHCTKDFGRHLRPLFAQAAEAADALLLCGDLTDYGLPEEAKVLADELTAASVPIVAVLGNHDFESGQQDEVRRISERGRRARARRRGRARSMAWASPASRALPAAIGRGSLGPWGEAAIKQFVNEALHEALKLESALAKLRTPQRIALLHYSPIVGTVEGEPIEIYPFLGSSRLEEPLLRYPVNAVFHGHAHRGQLEGKTVNGIAGLQRRQAAAGAHVPGSTGVSCGRVAEGRAGVAVSHSARRRAAREARRAWFDGRRVDDIDRAEVSTASSRRA